MRTLPNINVILDGERVNFAASTGSRVGKGVSIARQWHSHMDGLAANLIEAVPWPVCNAEFVNGLMGVAFVV
jgi:hypothetical protein